MKLFSTAKMLALVILAAGGEAASAQAPDYPSRPVTFVVPFAPGGVTSLFARLLSQRLEQRLGKPFVVENRPGGGGVTAAAGVAQAAPDGHTIMMASSTVLAINITLRKNLPYDPRKDLTPIALLARVPFVLVVNPALPVHSVADLVKLAKEKPGQICVRHAGPRHLPSHQRRDVPAHVRARPGARALQRFGTGPQRRGRRPHPDDVQRRLARPGADRIGQAAPLGVTTAQRVQAIAAVPPLAEVGMPGYETASWHTVTTTANVPRGIVDKLHDAIREAMSDPAVLQILAKDGTLPQVSPPPDELKQFVAGEIVRWGKILEEAGLAGIE